MYRHIRMQPRHWERIDAAAQERGIAANHLLVDLALEALDRRECPHRLVRNEFVQSAMGPAWEWTMKLDFRQSQNHGR